MKPYSLEHWLAVAAILAALVAIHWLAYRVQARRNRKRRREPPPMPTVVSRRRQDGFDGPIPIPMRDWGPVGCMPLAHADIVPRISAPPAGFRYRLEFLDPAEGARSRRALPGPPVQAFRVPGLPRPAARRRYGFSYDYSERSLQPAPEIPEFLLGIRERAARFAASRRPTSCTRSSPNTAPAPRSAGTVTDRLRAT